MPAGSDLLPEGRRELSGAGGDGQGQDRFVPLDAGRCYAFVSVGSASMPRLYTYLWDPRGKRLADHRSETNVSHFVACAMMPGPYHFQAKPARGGGEFRTGIYVLR